MNDRTRRAYGVGIAAFVVAASGCVVDSLDDRLLMVEDVEFAASLGIDLADYVETNSGLLIHDEIVGEGSPVVPGNNVVIAYSGWLPNGTLFDSSPRTDGNFPPIGVGGLILGFDEGVLNMKVGGLRWIIIPPELAYANVPPSGSGIPANSFLVFKIELLEIG